MKRHLIFACLAIALTLGGCQSSSTETKAPAVSAASSPTPGPSVGAVEAADKNDEGEHEHSAPHGGALVELGEEFAHIEIVLDAVDGTLIAYALDGEAEKSVRVKQSEIEITVRNPEVTIKLGGVSNALTGETANDTSEFWGQSDRLKGATDFDGVVKTIWIKGKQFKDVEFNFPKGAEK